MFQMPRYCPDEDMEEDKVPSSVESEDETEAAEDKEVEEEEDKEESPKAGDEQPAAKKKRKKNKKKKAANAENNDTGFTVLGETSRDLSKRNVKAVLPEWLANPDIVKIDFKENQLAVEDFDDLDSDLKERLKENEIQNFFPVQRQVIPHLLRKNRSAVLPWFRQSDICVSAPTGSGKTLAFVLPLIHSLKRRVEPQIRALVILPAQDLAAQVFKVFQTYAKGTGLRVKLVSASNPFGREQRELVRKGAVPGLWNSLVDILVATPGRLVDHIQSTEGFTLSHLRYVVVDEADRVMEDVQNDWLTHVEASINDGSTVGPLNVANLKQHRRQPQKLLFSATLSQNPEQLLRMNLFEPKLFACVVKPKDILGAAKEQQRAEESSVLEKFSTPAELKESLVNVKDSLKKPQILADLIRKSNVTRALVFVNSVEHAGKLAVLLSQFNLSVGHLSSEVQNSHKKVLNQFKAGTLEILVCTDSLARGIDIGLVDTVISYEPPKFAKTYVHRVGRTARAGKSGSAITLVEEDRKRKFVSVMNKSIERWSDKVGTIEVDEDSLDSSEYKEAMENTEQILKEKKMEAKVNNSRKKGWNQKRRSKK